MKVSNLLLASMLTSVVGVSAQTTHTAKDSLNIKEQVKPEATLEPIETQHKPKKDKKCKAEKKLKFKKLFKSTFYDSCPNCGMG